LVLDTGQGSNRTLDELVRVAHRVGTAVESVIEGKSDAVRLALTVLLAEGHVLIEDVPGVGKTMLAKALARSTGCSVRRIQFTPDLTVDGRTYPLTPPFMVIATQNPIEMEGTYPLPEAQRDRFTARISMGYPSAESELAMLDAHGSSSPLDTLEPVAQAEDIRELIAAVRTVHVAEPLKQYVIRLVAATRSSPELRLGASPRATLHLLRAGRARAALDGRDFVIPDDMQALAQPVLAHRLLPSAEAVVTQQSPERVLAAIVEHLPLPQLR
jgi:MoxR-like ATPase